MNSKTHNKFIFAVITTLLLLIGLLAYVNNNSTPKITGFSVAGGPNNAQFINQSIKIDFNRPMRNVSLTKADILMTPEANFTTSWSGNSLYIYFYENLQANTQYQLTLTTNIEDQYQKFLAENVTYTFKTQNYQFTYLEDTSSEDKIILADIENKRSTLFFSENIQLYDINPNYLVTISIVNEVDSLISITDISEKDNPIEVKNFVLANTKIARLDVSPTLSEFSYLAQRIEKSPEGFLIPKSGSLIYRYDIQQDSSTTINPDETANDALVLAYSGDGRYLLYRGTGAQFYIIDLKDPSKAIILGQFQSFAGINFDASYILFSDFDILGTFTQLPFVVRFKVIDRSTEVLTDPSEYVIDPQFFQTKNSILYSRQYREAIGSQGLFEVVLRNDTNQIIQIIREDNFSLELPQPSVDDSFIAAEKYSEKALQDIQNTRSLILQRKPKDASIVIFDTNSSKKILEIENGYELRWIN